MATRSEAASARSLNRLIVACKDDISALDAAARIIMDPIAKERLSSQSDQRESFVRDLETAVIAFGGKPARHRSMHAIASSLVAHVRVFVGGKHEGDAYARCVRVEERTRAAYAFALSGELRADTHFGVAQQQAELETDRKELRWMRDLC